MVVALSFGTSLVGSVVAVVLGGHAHVVVLALRAIGVVIGTAFVLVASIAIIPVLWFAEWLARLLKGQGEPPPDLPLSSLGRQSDFERLDPVESVPFLDPAVTEIGLALATLVLVAIVVWRYMRPSMPLELDGAETEERSSVFSWADYWGRRALSASPIETDRDGLNMVRRAYRSFLDALPDLGLARSPEETPNQLAQRLRIGSGGTIDVGPDLNTLTRSYEAVRYGTSSAERLGEAALDASRRLTSLLSSRASAPVRDSA
jgi:hypothetical protein